MAATDEKRCPVSQAEVAEMASCRAEGDIFSVGGDSQHLQAAIRAPRRIGIRATDRGRPAARLQWSRQLRPVSSRFQSSQGPCPCCVMRRFQEVRSRNLSMEKEGTMKKLFSVGVLCALAIGLVAVPGAVAKKGPKLVGGAVTGNVASNSGCRKDRDITFAWVNGAVVTPATGTAITGSNGDYTATVSRPTDTAPTATSVILRATVAQEFRKVGSKKKGKKNKKGRQFSCQSFSGDSPAVTLVP